MAEVLRNALWAHLARPAEALVVSRGARRLRLPAHEIEALAQELRDRGVRYGTGRELLAHRIAHVLLTQLEAAGETCDDRTHDAVRRSAPVRKCVDEVWPKVDPKKLVFALLSDQDQVLQNGGGLLSDAEMAALAWPKPPRGPGSAPWTRADQVLIDEAADLIERTPSIAHIVVDEAQDLSPMEVRAIGRRCATGAATVLGDLAQGTTPWAATSWPTCSPTWASRTPRSASSTSATGCPGRYSTSPPGCCPRSPPGCRRPLSLRADPDALRVRPVPPGQLGALVAASARRRLGRPGSVAVICADAQLAETGAALRAAGLAFGVLGDQARRADAWATCRAEPDAGPRRRRRPADPGPGHPGQGPGVRPRDPGRAGPDRDR